MFTPIFFVNQDRMSASEGSIHEACGRSSTSSKVNDRGTSSFSVNKGIT
jgi:hypothetical protein